MAHPIVSGIIGRAAVSIGLIAMIAGGCRLQDPPPLLELVPPDESGVTFQNRIVEGEGLNVLAYEYFYNGGGVAAGDVNGDGLPDLYFTANMGPNALYINEGDFRFRDVTKSARVEGGPGWTTGVVMADVNDDGWLDIYVCKSGRVSDRLRRNELYINNGDLTFTERAAEFGLDDPSYSTHASFFDSDRDGDLDMFLVNHAVDRFSRFDAELVRQMRDSLAGDKLFRNENGRFVDASVEAGISGNPIGFGLSATVSDVNGDGWPDIYVANDYVEDDYLYINNGDGTFSNQLRDRLDVTSYSSMGVDIADVNNDGHPDIFSLDMISEDPVRRKQLQGPNDFVRYRGILSEGYYRQHMRNMLQLNNGDGTFSEIGQLAGVAETDWSWTPLFADFDNDGLKDLFVTNGYLRDYTDLDFLMSVLLPAVRSAQVSGDPIDADAIASKMPQTVVTDYIYRNVNGLQFEKAAWGVSEPSFSNGATVVDLDLDGDQDLVVNTINREAMIYRNHAGRFASNRYLTVKLNGPPGNRFGIGAVVQISTAGTTQVQEMQPARGYQSSVPPVMHFGTGTSDVVDVHVRWPDGRQQRLEDVSTNTTITLVATDAVARPAENEDVNSRAFFVSLPGNLGIDFFHQEDPFLEFERDPLLSISHARLGPALASADVNGDRLQDVFIGGALGQPAALYLQQLDGRFARVPVEAFDRDAIFEDVAAAFFDAEGDGDPDLYVVSGGSHEIGDGSVYQDRLYLNAGFGRFESSDALPPMPSSGGAVAPHDFDGDGDIDLFIGGRILPGRYPEPPRSYLLRNDAGRFTDVTPDILKVPGMVTSALWADLNARNAGVELAISGEWMPIRIFRIDAQGATELTGDAGLSRTNGWWNALYADDLNGDGRIDLIAGNRGLNHFLRADVRHPVSLYAADFGRDATIDPILTYVFEDRRYPVAWRDELLDQVPALRRKFPDYRTYAGAEISEILTKEDLENALRLDAFTFETSLFEQQANGSFVQHRLPLVTQFSPVNDIVTIDVNQDGLMDVITMGNNSAVRAQWGPFLAGRGALLLNAGEMQFTALSPQESGLSAPGDVRALDVLETTLGTLIIAVRNDDEPLSFGVNYRSIEPALALTR